MVTLIAVGKVEHGGPVEITATALPDGADHPVKPLPVDGRDLYLRCLEAEGCPAEWADAVDPLQVGIEHEPAIELDYYWIRTGC